MNLRQALEDCPDCRGTGWLRRERDGLTEVLRCPKCTSSRDYQRRLKAARIPPRYLDKGFEEYAPQNSSQRTALRRAREFAEAFPTEGGGLLFSGPCGVGKTHLSAAILMALIGDRQVDARFVDETEFLRRLQYSYEPNSEETQRDVLDPLMGAELVVWDDLGTGRPTEWVRETMRTIINHRYTFQRPTIFSTNWPIDGDTRKRTGVRIEETLGERIGVRVLSRILEMCEIVSVRGPDFRTEIHRPATEFQRARESRTEPVVSLPTGRIHCPSCNGDQVDNQDVSPLKDSPSGSYYEIACLCRACQLPFFARYFPHSGEISYPELK